MRFGNERGEGRIGAIFGFIVMAACGMVVWNLTPVYWNNYQFADKVNELARLSRYQNTDDVVMQKIMTQAHDFYLDDYIKPQQCKIVTGEHSRRINCAYERTVKILPGFTKIFKFDIAADQPLL
jgi:hypothetical protein